MVLYTKFQDNGPMVLEKKIFKVLSIFEHGIQLGLVTMTILLSLFFSIPRLLHIKYTII